MHPILLPRHSLTDHIIRKMHERYHHASNQITLYNLRQRYWLTDEIRYEKLCIRVYDVFGSTLIMLNIKQEIFLACVLISFINTVDFCGSFYINEKKYRNRVRIKIYICISIKAVYLVVVSGLMSDGFLAALRWFITRHV